MPRGGKRPNAGRSTKFTREFKLALINEFGLLKAEHPRWTSQRILTELVALKKLSEVNRKAVTRFLETRFNLYNNADGEIDIRQILTENERQGILTVLPTLPIEKKI